MTIMEMKIGMCHFIHYKCALNSTCNLYELPLKCAHHFLTYSRCATPLTSRMKISTLPSGTSRKSEAKQAGGDDLIIDLTILVKSESDSKEKSLEK